MKPAFVIVGLILFTAGLIFSQKIWWSLDGYFARHSGVAIPFALIVVSAILVWIGMYCFGIGVDAFG